MADMETFVVRIWSPAGGDTQDPSASKRLHGVLDHIRTGRSTQFRDVDGLVLLVHQGCAAPVAADDKGEQR